MCRWMARGRYMCRWMASGRHMGADGWLVVDIWVQKDG